MKVKCIDVADLDDSTMVLGEIYEAQHITDTHYRINGHPYYQSRFEIVEEEPEMSNKEKLQQQLEQLQKTIDDAQKQAEKIREELNKPEYKALFDLSDQFKQYVLSSRFLYPDQETAKAYHEALDTFIQLRKCHGSEPVTDTEQYFISPNESVSPRILSSRFIGDKVSEISPAFDTRQNAQNAINSVGEENIINMFKTFHGVK